LIVLRESSGVGLTGHGAGPKILWLRRVLAKAKIRLVRAREEKDLVRATALAWFNNARAAVEPWQATGDFRFVDQRYTALLEASEHDSRRERYVADLRHLRNGLVKLRTSVLTIPYPAQAALAAQPPDFSPLVADQVMQVLLVDRWRETQLCIGAGANLAAVAMMGGLLEGLLRARLNAMSDKGPAFRALAAPRDKSGSVLPLREWTLRHFLDVGHELTWIARSARDVGVVLRDYRNYVHPEKQRSHGVSVTAADAATLWAVTISLASQVVASSG
jgi:hypothetical protein